MSAASERGRALLAMSDPDPFVLIECRRIHDVDGLPAYGFEVSWGDQIHDDDIPDVLADLLCTMTEVDRDQLARLMNRT